MRFHSFTWLDSRLSSTREYRLNDHFFSRLGFTKQTDGDASIYRYSNPLTTNNIIEVVYQPEFGVLSIGEFVAEPVSLEAEMTQYNDWLVLYIKKESIKRTGGLSLFKKSDVISCGPPTN